MSRHWSITAAIACCLVAVPLAAQRVSRDTTVLNTVPSATVAPLPAVSAIGDQASVFVATRATPLIETRARVADVARLRSMMPHDVSRNSAMMIVGGAAMLVGAVVGGKVGATIGIGGGVLGFVGLWNYMK